MPDGAYLITRWRDCDAVYRDARVFSSDKKIEFRPKYGDAPLYRHHTTSLVFNDPPLHTHVRRAIQMALSNRVVAEMEEGLVALVDRLLDAMEAKGRADVIEDFAAAIPVEIIGNLLGVPHADRGPLRGWSLAILGALEPVLTAEQMALGNDAVRDFSAYLKGLIDDRRAHPRDPDKDLLTRLIRGEHEGRKLSEDELTQNCIFILNAGHETTTNLIGNALEIFIRFPDERERLIEDSSLARSAVEEALRFESSNQLGNRIITEDTQISGILMPKGTLVTIGIGAANRDPRSVPRSRPLRCCAQSDAASGLRFRHPHVRRHEPRAARRARRDRAISQAISALCGGRRADAQPPRALPRFRRAPHPAKLSAQRQALEESHERACFADHRALQFADRELHVGLRKYL